MHATRPTRKDRNTFTLPSFDPARVSRGHARHHSGAGKHADRRTARLRSRGDQRRAALNQE